MRLYTAIIVGFLLAGCATRHSIDYSWEVSVCAIGTHEYEFTGKLKRSATQDRRTPVSSNQDSESDVLCIPTMTVTPEKPGEVVIGNPGEEPVVKAHVTVQETPDSVIIKYSARINDEGMGHAVNGRTEIRR